ncbi:hypothetical protein [Streptomyces chattanoogensis]|uniref:hypothetical protein n=1 Tax=Streptomyces chattanoogensis TaxID=66876 RepID=UPI0036AED051
MLRAPLQGTPLLADPRTRGRRLDGQVAELRRIWSGEPLTEGVRPDRPAPAPSGGLEVLFGGFVPAVVERVARFGDGFPGAALPSQQMDGCSVMWRRPGPGPGAAVGRDCRPRSMPPSAPSR